jgi:hypothetical protein
MSRITTDTYCSFPRIEIHQSNTRPSWKRYGGGYAQLKVVVAPNWLSLVSSEGCETSTRTTMLTLSKEEAIALCAFLVDHVQGEECHKNAAP